MTFEATPLYGNYIISLKPVGDERGWFARTYCMHEFAQIDHNKVWVQMNHSFSAKKGTIRGLHFQRPPHTEIKMVRCIAGAVFDVVVDLRKNAGTYLQWFGTELSAHNKKMMYIPEGFAHGFQALTDDAELVYQHTDYYTPDAEEGLLYNDERLNIKWPLPVTEISERDQHHKKIDLNFKAVI